MTIDDELAAVILTAHDVEKKMQRSAIVGTADIAKAVERLASSVAALATHVREGFQKA